MTPPACTLRPGRELEANAGELRATWQPRRGGQLSLVRDGLAATFDVRISGTEDGEPVELRQSFDVQPTLLPLEEGAERVGVRSLWSLVDDAGTGYGEALQDVFVTRHGEVFLALALRIATRAPLVVEHAALHVELEGVEQTAVDEPGLIARAGDLALLARWPAERARRYDTLQWQQAHSPFYERWPPLFDQWCLDPETYGWSRIAGAGGSIGAAENGRASARVAWIDGGRVAATPQLDLRGLVWLGLGPESDVRRLARAHEEPLAPTVEGGRLRSYDELDGAYEVAITGSDECAVEFPADPLARPLRVRVHGLAAHGGLEVGPEADIQLLSERGRPDDPLVWVEVPPHGRADEALVTLRARPDRPTRVALRTREGLHVAYQRRDPRRRLTIHHPADRERPMVTIDLASLHLVDLRLPGQLQPAIHDAPLFWMRYLPKAAAHLANRLTTFELVESSPELVVVQLESETPDGLVRSRYRIEVPYRADCAELRVRAELEGAAAWGLTSFEYADVFPENGIEPARWEYDRIAYVARDGVRVTHTRRPYPTLTEHVSFPINVLDVLPAVGQLPDAGSWVFGRHGAVVFGGSERGTIVAIASNPDPDRLEHVAMLCEHWADVHFDAAARATAPVPDAIVAELTLRVHDPRDLTFDQAVAAVQAEVASLSSAAVRSR
jgi:hypothetical protein